MKAGTFWRDVRGATALEFALTAPVFFMLLFGIVNGGMLLWTQVALQHGAEMAARCASVDSTTCGSAASIKAYAAQQALGLNPKPDLFSVDTAECGVMVTANYSFAFFTTYFGSGPLTVTARSCFPT